MKNEWSGSMSNLIITVYNVQLEMLKFPIHLMVVYYEFKLFHFKNNELLKMGES